MAMPWICFSFGTTCSAMIFVVAAVISVSGSFWVWCMYRLKGIHGKLIGMASLPYFWVVMLPATT